MTKPRVVEEDDGRFRVYVGDVPYSDHYDEPIFAEHIAERVIEIWGDALGSNGNGGKQKRAGNYRWEKDGETGTVYASSLAEAKRHVRSLLKRKRLQGITIELEV